MAEEKKLEPSRVGLLGFMLEAFKVPYHWILLGGALGAAVLTVPWVALPLLGAAELVYLVGVAHNPRFQRLVAAKRKYDARAPVSSIPATQAAFQLLGTLAKDRRLRFERVRSRCLDLQKAFKTVGAPLDSVLERSQNESVNKLLWVFARTLAYEQMLDTFCSQTPSGEIKDNLAKAERLLAQPEGLSEELKRAHTENVQVLKQRLENLRRAETQLESLQARLVRVENSIMLIQEQSLTRRDPAALETEVSAVTAGLSSVEEVFQSMDLPDVGPLEEGPAPELLAAPPPLPVSE
jgi:hypothetical protein